MILLADKPHALVDCPACSRPVAYRVDLRPDGTLDPVPLERGLRVHLRVCGVERVDIPAT